MALPIPPPPPSVGSAAPPVAATLAPPPPPAPPLVTKRTPPPPVAVTPPAEEVPPWETDAEEEVQAPAPVAPTPAAPTPPAPPAPPVINRGAPTAPAAPAAPPPVQAAPVAPPIPAAPPMPVQAAPMPAPAQPLAVVAESTPTDMAAAVPGGGALAAQFAEEGFEGLDFGFGSLPIVSLNQGTFQTSDGQNLGTEFWALLKQSRPKYLLKTALADTDPRNALMYSYDGLTDIRGEPLQAKLEAWARQGISYERKQYLEVVAQLANQDTVLLSVPPTSVRRLSGALANMRNRGQSIDATWVRVHIGAKVTNVPKPFSPWGFEPQNS